MLLIQLHSEMVYLDLPLAVQIFIHCKTKLGNPRSFKEVDRNIILIRNIHYFVKLDDQVKDPDSYEEEQRSKQ